MHARMSLKQEPSFYKDLSLVELLQVKETRTPDVFEGLTEDYGPVGIYGGHFLGQALSAALATVEEPKITHSFHSYFLRRGEPNIQLFYKVTRLRDSQNGATRNIEALQEGKAIFQMTASFKTEEEGDQHQQPPADVPSPEESLKRRLHLGAEPFPFPMTKGDRVQMEWASDSFLDFDTSASPELRVWMKIPKPTVEPCRRDRQIILAFLSDGTLMFNSILPYGKPWDSHRLTSLDHCTWFHSDVDPFEWMLYDQRSSAAADGRGLNDGRVYSHNGQLVMSCQQESMLRRIAGENG